MRSVTLKVLIPTSRRPRMDRVHPQSNPRITDATRENQEDTKMGWGSWVGRPIGHIGEDLGSFFGGTKPPT